MNNVIVLHFITLQSIFISTIKSSIDSIWFQIMIDVTRFFCIGIWVSSTTLCFRHGSRVFLFVFGPESEKSSTDEGKRRRILDQPRAIAGPQVVYPLVIHSQKSKYAGFDATSWCRRGCDVEVKSNFCQKIHNGSPSPLF